MLKSLINVNNPYIFIRRDLDPLWRQQVNAGNPPPEFLEPSQPGVNLGMLHTLEQYRELERMFPGELCPIEYIEASIREGWIVYDSFKICLETGLYSEVYDYDFADPAQENRHRASLEVACKKLRQDQP